MGTKPPDCGPVVVIEWCVTCHKQAGFCIQSFYCKEKGTVTLIDRRDWEKDVAKVRVIQKGLMEATAKRLKESGNIRIRCEIAERDVEKLALQRSLLRNERDTLDRMWELSESKFAAQTEDVLALQADLTALRGELDKAIFERNMFRTGCNGMQEQRDKWKATYDKLRAGVKGTNKWRVSSSIEVQELLDYLDAILRDGVTCSICEQDELPASHVCPNGTEGGG